MPRAFSGIQPTGDIHIGNYFGAIQNYVKLGQQLGKQAIYCVVDLHALTNPAAYDRDLLASRTFEATLVNMAAGLDPEQVILFAQSDVREHNELAWIFTTQTPVGELERMTQYKDKTSKLESVPSGLLMYPVLMAADILLYKADTVPVGEDQEQHLELTREIARRFNYHFGDTFPEPQAVHAEDALRVPGIDGQGKMSKSKGNTLGVLEDFASIWSKLKVAPTDPARIRRTDPGDPHHCLIYHYHKLFSDPGVTAVVEVECARAGIGCVDCKKFLMTGVERSLTPIQDRARVLRADADVVHGALERGAREAQAIAAPVMQEVREKIGLVRARQG
ncbi:tryptophan--tRNA ligase [Deinococcus peraridilitoris]|uniref:Tryptophan--tRNA ligase n=1 Tax=Deinococcus peraridilitoris (strain DSM 19664 / LMG 22246 / CIP 109416 / KR-200) TaxID=937777 RepID=K9ZWA4_DEIPD|nr:tryptophan--tRNA ligase [Deinococcus peraridilitoris]AFZ65923.1 tryptophanyl-tRNA synthetase [Deinococcus peraridilitoris DSM 19664]